jgi:hypothetical protein
VLTAVSVEISRIAIPFRFGSATHSRIETSATACC